MTRYGVLMYEYLDGDTPLIGSRVFESEERAQRFAFQVAGRGERASITADSSPRFMRCLAPGLWNCTRARGWGVSFGNYGTL